MDFGPMWETNLGVISNKQQLQPRMTQVTAGRILERGMLVTWHERVDMADAGTRVHEVGVIETDCDNTDGNKWIAVYGSGAIVCVKAGLDIETDYTGLKVWDRGTVAPMEEGEPRDLLVARTRGPTRIGEKWEPIPAGSPVWVIMK